MNLLFKIPLGGFGTAEVESFASYLYRISFEHGLTVGEMLDHIYRSAGESVSKEMELPKSPRGVLPESLIRPSKLVQACVRMLELMTEGDLTQSTLWFMGRQVGRSKNEVVSGFRWCPECLSEMLLVGEEPYFKLIWHLKEISHCPHHKTPLIGFCESCGSDQSTHKRCFPVFICQECGSTLANRQKEVAPSELSISWHISGTDILELFYDLAKFDGYSLHKTGVDWSIRTVFYAYAYAGKKDEFLEIFGSEEVNRIIVDRKQVSLKVARRFAYRLGVSLFVLFKGEALYSTRLLSDSWVCHLPAGFVPVEQKSPHDHELVLTKLRAVLKSNTPCLSKKQLASNLGVSAGYLEYRFPAITAEVVRRHRQLIEYAREQREESAKKAALSYFVSPKYAELPKSRKQAYRVLRQETGLPKFMLKDAISGVYNAIHRTA